MRLLILGGTAFLGRHLAAAALARGHRLTLFTRGRTRPELFPGTERLRGDRTRDLDALRGKRWDAVVDTSGYTPGAVGRAAELLAGAVGHYTFVSSVSVYDGYPAAGLDETADVGKIPPEEVAEAERIAADTTVASPSFGRLYGPLKALCEEAVEAALPGRTLSVRPGLIVGPHDPSGRFTYWVRRVADGGEVLAPGRGDHPLRVIDARDLADWILDRAEAATPGVLNAAGARGATLERLLVECREASASDASFTWVDEGFLAAEGVGPWMELPLWLPEDSHGFFAIRDDRALAAGLRFRPLAATVRDTLGWIRSLDAVPSWGGVGLASAKEAALLDRFAKPRRASS